jgi:guanosine-3',5'-bis(diphosphate) 3'-pyrophosphohydrolase
LPRALASAEADITYVDMGDDGKADDASDLRFLIAVRNKAHLETALRNLKRTPSVIKARRKREFKPNDQGQLLD